VGTGRERAHLKLGAGAVEGLPFVGTLPCELRHSAPNEQRPCWKKRHTGADIESCATSRRGRYQLVCALESCEEGRRAHLAQRVES